jgi:tetratricopeptide (TPR) repeat protein
VSQEQQHHELSDHEVLLNLLDKVVPFFKKNGLHILTVFLVLALAAVLLRTAHFRRVAHANEAWSVLASLPESTILADELALGDPGRIAQEREDAIAECLRCLDQPKSDATPWLLYKLANLQAAGRDWSEAVSTYERLIREYADSAAADAAGSAMAAALEDAGEYRRAAQAYERAAAAVGSLFLVDAGRAWELAGEASAAERCYNAARTAGLGSRYEDLVASRLQEAREGRLLPEPPAYTAPEPTGQSALGPMLVPADTEAAPVEPAPPAPE